MNVDAIFGQARPLLRLFGAILIVCATAKLLGANFWSPGDVGDMALVGLGLCHI